MKHFLSSLIAAAGLGAGAALAADVGVSITIGHPDFFGRIELGNLTPPPVVYARPVIIEHPVHEVVVEPLYLRVPPEHQKNWRKFCGRYDACGRPVYFVKDDWYRNVYAPHYREEHRDFRREELRHEEYREERREEERREEHRDRKHDQDERHDHHDHGDRHDDQH